MKAAQINEYGGIDKVFVQESVKPNAKDGQVLVKVMAASVNPFDVTLASGVMAQMIPLSLPYTIGGDLAGLVEATGEEVMGTALVANGGSGAMAEYATMNTKNIATKPKDLSWEEAASLPLAGCSALQAIEEHINIQSGQKILIHGGAGGIGTLAIQIAKSHGAYVAATARSSDAELLKAMGADSIIDYATEDFTTRVSEYDAVFDTVGGEVTNKSFAVLKRGGVLVTMIGKIDESMAKEHGVTAIHQSTGVTTERLTKIANYVRKGKLKPVVDRVFPMTQAKEAYEYFVNDHPKGKVVVTCV